MPAFGQNESMQVTAPIIELQPILQDNNLFYVAPSDLALMATQMSTMTLANSAPATNTAQTLFAWDDQLESSPLPQVEPTMQNEFPEEAGSSEDTPLTEILPIPGTVGEVGHDGGITMGELAHCNDANEIVVQVYLGNKPVVFLLDRNNPQTPSLQRLTDYGWGKFLNWHPHCQQMLVRMEDSEISDPGLWLIDIQERSHVQISIPELGSPRELVDAAFSPDGSKLAYITTQGIGFGSKLFMLDMATQERQLLRTDELSIAGGLGWSPDGAKIAFMLLLDAPVPFAEAGIWRMNADGTEQHFVARMDGGRGQKPIWSHDSRQLIFVAREVEETPEAVLVGDYIADALISSIEAVNIVTGETTILVDSQNARQLDIELLPDGSLLFVSTRTQAVDDEANAITEIWLRSPTGQLEQVTLDGTSKRHPIYLSEPPSN
jgi:hypothetical protein